MFRPAIRRYKSGGLGLLGQFDEAALLQKQTQLQQLRAERQQLEAEIQSVKTGRPIQKLGAPPAPATEPSNPLSAVSGLPTWAWLAAAGAGAFLLLRRRS